MNPARSSSISIALGSLVLCFGLAACGERDTPPTTPPASAPTQATAPEAEHKAVTTEKLEPYSCGTIQQLHTYQGVFLASQPAAEDLEQAKAGGVKTVIDLRRPTEDRGFDEPAKVASLGLTYHNPAFAAPEDLTDELLDETRELLREQERPILLHCASANRVGAVWLAFRTLDGGLSYDEALAEAKVVGLKTPALEEAVRAYIERRR